MLTTFVRFTKLNQDTAAAAAAAADFRKIFLAI